MKPILFVVIVLASIAGSSGVAYAADAEARCGALRQTDFSGVYDAPPVVTSTRLVAATKSLVAYCDVEGRIPIAPSVEFELRLPMAGWNGKFLAIPNIESPTVCDGYLERGYSCAPMYRNGKRGQRDDSALKIQRSSVNQFDGPFLQAHILTVSGKAIIERFYGAAPLKSYFMGCSAGGFAALTEAQSFPWDYDGIIAGDPNLDTADWSIRVLWTARSLLDRDGKVLLDADDITLLHRAVLDRCDLDDGVRDGVLGNAAGCKFDPIVLACKEGQKTGCLTPMKVAAVRRIYTGPRTSRGLQLATPGVLPGSELQWKDILDLNGLGALLLDFSFEGTNPKINATNFDFDRDYRRLGPGALEAHNNPDLRKFKAAGGKIILYAGTNDTAQVVPGIIDYSEITEKAMGGRAATQDFFRLFMVPGATHCRRGDGADAVDYLSYLEAWVEKGHAPDMMVAARVHEGYLTDMTLPETPTAAMARLSQEARARLAATFLRYPLSPAIPVDFTRPLYPYPRYAKYRGSGDPNNAANFRPIDPRSSQ